MYGVRYGNAEICSVLLEFGAAIGVQDIYSMAALIVATRVGDQAIVGLLKGRTHQAAVRRTQPWHQRTAR